MLFKERVLSLFIYVIILFIMLFFITKIKRKQIKIILNIYILILSMMGYLYKPLGNLYGGADLNRIFYYVEFYHFTSYKELYMAIKNSTTPGIEIYYTLINILGNKNLLPTITAFIAFSFWFGIIKTILKNDKKIKKTEIVISIFLFMSRGLFLQTISNIRTLLGMSILTWCTYQEFYNKKNLTKLLPYYFLGSSFHSIVQVVFIYRIIYYFFENLKNKENKKKILAYIISGLILIYLGGNKYFLKIQSKAQSYIEYSRLGINYFYIWEYLLAMFSIVIIIYLIYNFKKSYKIEKIIVLKIKYMKETNNLINYITPLLLISILISFIEFNTFLRLTWYLNGVCIPIVIYVIKQERIKCQNIEQLIKNLIIISIIMLFISCARGDLCGLNFFDKF